MARRFALLSLGAAFGVGCAGSSMDPGDGTGVICGLGTMLVGNVCLPVDDESGGESGAEIGVDVAATTSTDADSSGSSSGDEDIPPFDINTAVVYNSPADISTWAETATLTVLDMNLEGVFVDFTKRDGVGSWPDVPFGAPGDSLEYTLWIALFIDGTWYTSGCIQYWRDLERNGGAPSGVAENWYYDVNRWKNMTGYQPALGEQVGFFVSAGDARNVTDHSGSIVFERSNIVMVPFPADPGAHFEF